MPFTHSDVEVLDARQALGKVRSVRDSAWRTASSRRLDLQVLDAPREAQAVERARAATDLVEDDEAARVALLRMFAVSLISTMKVDCPRARSSLAPMRVKMRSTRSMRAVLAE